MKIFDHLSVENDVTYQKSQQDQICYPKNETFMMKVILYYEI